jgi:hypothetical protein
MFAVLATFALGCIAPGQYGGPIPVDNGGLGGRLVVLCRAGVMEQARGTCIDDLGDARDADADDSAEDLAP